MIFIRTAFHISEFIALKYVKVCTFHTKKFTQSNPKKHWQKNFNKSHVLARILDWFVWSLVFPMRRFFYWKLLLKKVHSQVHSSLSAFGGAVLIRGKVLIIERSLFQCWYPTQWCLLEGGAYLRSGACLRKYVHFMPKWAKRARTQNEDFWKLTIAKRRRYE